MIRDSGARPPRLHVSLIACVLLAACSTVGVSNHGEEWAIVEPTIANEMIFDNRQLVIIDLRPSDEFDGTMGHIPGATSIPTGALESRMNEIRPYRKATILVYADAESDATEGANILAGAGFRSIVVIRGGIRAWIERGYATVSGP